MSIDFDPNNMEPMSFNIAERQLNMTKMASSLKHNFSVDRHKINKEERLNMTNDLFNKKLIGLKKNNERKQI